MIGSRDALAAVRAAIMGTSLVNGIGGGVYYMGTRPKDSQAEDLILTHVGSEGTEAQDGRVMLTVWVPCLIQGGGAYVENMARTVEVERMMAALREELTGRGGRYLIELAGAPETILDEEAAVSYVTAKIRYRFI